METINTARSRKMSSKYVEQQNHYTHGDAIDQFKAAMLEAGIVPPDNIIGDGSLHRFKIDGKLNGWYILHLDGQAAGILGDWKQGIKERWKMTGKFMPLSDFRHKSLKPSANVK